MVNWKVFDSKFDKREQWAFENMSYFLFCAEMNCHIGLFRYKNQAGIETEPIKKNGKFYGFQAKYYSTPISQNKDDIINSLCTAKAKNANLDVILLYLHINQELSEGKKKKKPQYQIDIEHTAHNIGIEIEWRVPSYLEYQLLQPNNKWILDIFFGNNGLSPDFFDRQIEKETKNLGPRFNKELNFELPIAQLFDNISHNEIFYRRLIKVIDKWLTEKSYRKLKDNEHLAEIEKDLYSLKNELIEWVKHYQYSIDNAISLSPFFDKLYEFDKIVEAKKNELYSQIDWKNSSNIFENELSRLREIENADNDFLKEIEKLKINLANNPTLVIQGEAGCGKSHLLGDIATQRKKQSLPTLLLLGTTFTNTNTIEKNILDKLDLTCTFNDVLINLNNIGLQINSRILILIDAINEGAGADLWKNQIAGFINEIAKYPAIGLVLTIRSTYFNDIIPDSFKSDSEITIVTHTGFKGNEYEALKLFCEHYGLKLPNFPILNPEYSNPLFLHLICEAVESMLDKSFPKGFNGINKTYNLYKEVLNRKFEEKRHEYKHREIVSLAIEKIADALFKSEYGQLECKEVVSLFDNVFPLFPHLLSDLIEECVLIKMRYEYSETPKDLISFSYQKLGDYFIAEELLKPYKTAEELKSAFENDSKFHKITNQYQWSHRGLIEAFSILLPEKYNLELFELIDFFFDKNINKQQQQFHNHNTYEWFVTILSDSLKWREINSIDNDKITNWINENTKYIRDNEWLYTLTELSAIPNHPFNSDRLNRFLTLYSMPERDGFWQQYLLWYNGYNDNDVAFPLRRLIDWAWSPNISYNSDGETARLVAQTLSWVLSSTNITLRDQTTKALVNLLEQQPEVLIDILKTFEKVDDLYILERLYAVAYGCILRTEKNESIKLIAQYIYKTIFNNGNPPIHILLRDYARNAVEYAIYKNVELDVDVILIRPPYSTEMPILPITEDEVKQYQLDYDSSDFKQKYGYEHNAVYSSVIAGIADFGHYTVESAVDHFASFSFREDEEYDNFLKTLKKNPRECVKILYDCSKRLKDFHNKTDYQKQIGLDYSATQQTYLDMLQDIKSTITVQLKELLNEEQTNYLNDTVIPYFDRKLNIEHFNAWSIRYWIVKRVFELGYNKELHGEYDSSVRNYNDYSRHENKIERIGKKYQWIAFYEILATLADNYKLKDGWGSDSKYEFYKGTWQNYLRNIDPAYITKNKDENEDKVGKIVKEWWEDEGYFQWNHPDAEWVQTTDDLIPPENIIQKQDTQGDEWLRLQYYITWREPKKIGKDQYEGRRKEIWYMLQGYLVKKTEKQKIINYLTKQNFFGRWMPENNDDFSSLFNREKFWSPAYLDTYKGNKKIWSPIRDTNYKVIVANESAKGLIESDKSGANQSYNIPCKFIFEGMGLQYAPIDGDLINLDGKIIVTNNSSRGILIKKKELMQFLEENNLDIVWTILGEKFSFIDSRQEESYFKAPCGIYYFENGLLKGEMNMYDRD